MEIFTFKVSSSSNSCVAPHELNPKVLNSFIYNSRVPKCIFGMKYMTYKLWNGFKNKITRKPNFFAKSRRRWARISPRRARLGFLYGHSGKISPAASINLAVTGLSLVFVWGFSRRRREWILLVASSTKLVFFASNSSIWLVSNHSKLPRLLHNSPKSHSKPWNHN